MLIWVSSCSQLLFWLSSVYLQSMHSYSLGFPYKIMYNPRSLMDIFTILGYVRFCLPRVWGDDTLLHWKFFVHTLTSTFHGFLVSPVSLDISWLSLTLDVLYWQVIVFHYLLSHICFLSGVSRSSESTSPCVYSEFANPWIKQLSLPSVSCWSACRVSSLLSESECFSLLEPSLSPS